MSEEFAKNKNGQKRDCPYYGRAVVVDTCARWVYIGTYAGDDGIYCKLENADAFDVSETSLSKHEYLRMVKKDGVAPNRKKVSVLKSMMVAITLLDDILEA